MYAAELLTAQRNRHTPEGRMAEAAIIKRITPAPPLTNQNSSGTPLQRLTRRIAFGASDCWYWIGSIDPLGYGRFMAVGENRAHRAAYRILRGPIPEGMKVLHKCDTRCCVNPDHLFIGTQAENVHDMRRKGRGRSGDVRGEANPMAKLTAELVGQIRERASNGEKQIELSRAYGVSPMTISRVVRKELWA